MRAPSDSAEAAKIKKVTLVAARTMIALLLLVPLWLVLKARPGDVAWLVWAVVSVAAGLDAIPIASHAFPLHRTPTPAVMISVLALLNVVFSLSVVMFPLFRN